MPVPQTHRVVKQTQRAQTALTHKTLTARCRPVPRAVRVARLLTQNGAQTARRKPATVTARLGGLRRRNSSVVGTTVVAMPRPRLAFVAVRERVRLPTLITTVRPPVSPTGRLHARPQNVITRRSLLSLQRVAPRATPLRAAPYVLKPPTSPVAA